ncbi:hypothetical protein NP233_g9358 [Leucocoprinus birnbaumii]|uniref:Uncharacterized protein n=1 Tax=Leucocoprinus birnbaumii TaxID=56174 RepID=A0AAD5YSX8_9AGAR|nr:hypothetical protein NP233_g9358 [Leucocoprinus birnbaumii]
MSLPPPITFFPTGPTKKTTEKFQDDVWCSNPPQVTSYIIRPRSGFPGFHTSITYTSPACGLGWRFELHESTSSQKPFSPPQLSTKLYFHPQICSSMTLKNPSAKVKVSYPDAENPPPTCERLIPDVIIRSTNRHDIGEYDEPSKYRGRAVFEITITFDPSDELSFPTTSPTSTKKALRQSLDNSSFHDTKFYLFSRKSLVDRLVLRFLLSRGTEFSGGTPCDISKDVQQEIQKLNPDSFDYDSDSDLDPDESDSTVKEKTLPPSEPEDSLDHDKSTTTVQPNEQSTADHSSNARAFAINGTAYKTWKAFIYYAYTKDIVFNQLKSQGIIMKHPTDAQSEDADIVRCSPKSMYRFADYADIPALKSLTKEAIGKRLTKANIVAELFSSFTQKYTEIIEMEADFLVANFTPEVARRFDEMLQVIVLGVKPNSFRVLAFSIRRLRGHTKEAAWNALDPLNDTNQSYPPTVLPSLSGTRSDFPLPPVEPGSNVFGTTPI